MRGFCGVADMITAAAAPAKACKLQQPCGVFVIRIWEFSSLGFWVDCELMSEAEVGLIFRSFAPPVHCKRQPQCHCPVAPAIAERKQAVGLSGV